MKTAIEMAREAKLFTHKEVQPELKRLVELARADEREAIYDEWWSCVMSDLENGVKSLNEKAAADWHKNYPAQSKSFPEWIEARSGT